MDPVVARKRIKSFLLQHEFDKKILKDVASQELEKYVLRYKQMNENEPTDEACRQYMASICDDVHKKADIAMDDLCKHMVPERQFTYFLKKFGTLSIVLVPSLYSICTLIAAGISKQVPSLTDISMAIAAMGFAIILAVLYLSAKNN